MRKLGFLFLLLFPASVAFANPTVDPTGSIFNFLVFGSALWLEVSITTIILLFFNLSPVPVFVALLIGNLGVYFGLFGQLLDETTNLLMLEMMIVIIEGTFIKLISLIEAFQLETFTKLKWKYAFLSAAVGNVVSYYVGVVVGL